MSTSSSSSSFFQKWSGSSSNVPGGVKKETRAAPIISVFSNSSNVNIIDEVPVMGGRDRDRSGSMNGQEEAEISPYRNKQFDKILLAENIDLVALRKLAWNGVPWKYRTQVWQLLLGYMPTNKSRRSTTLIRKRKEYQESVVLYFDIPDSDRTTEETELLRQIIVDIHRTCPMMPFFHQQGIQKLMERILYVWSIRHPASGYVQGMNDLLTPLLLVSLYPHVINNNSSSSSSSSSSIGQTDVLRCDVAQISIQTMLDVEADTYWCLTKLLDDIQDHYTASQPGIQRMVLKLEDLMKRIDGDLNNHFEAEGVNYVQFAFRWMNCILLRELSMRATIRLWDTYISEDVGGFENFHVYVCAALLQTYREVLLNKPFQDMLLFLQDMPSAEWGEREVEPVLSQAFILSSLFEFAQAHLS